MARDKTLEQEIESTLYAGGVLNSGAMASAIMDRIRERVEEATSVRPVNQWQTGGEAQEELSRVLEALR